MGRNVWPISLPSLPPHTRPFPTPQRQKAGVGGQGEGEGWNHSSFVNELQEKMYCTHQRVSTSSFLKMFLLFIVWEFAMYLEHISPPPTPARPPPFYPLNFVFFISWWIGRTMEKGTCKGFIGARIRGACENAVFKPAWGKKHVEHFSETLTNAFAQVQLNGANTSHQALTLSSMSRDE